MSIWSCVGQQITIYMHTDFQPFFLKSEAEFIRLE